MIRLERASLRGLFEDASISMGAGEICALLAESDESASRIVKLFAGLERLSSGTLHVLGESMADLSDGALFELRKRIGVVMKNGGLVSNLKVWENILLPLSYHGLLSDEEAESRLTSLLERIGFDEDTAKLPEMLPIHARKMAGLMRAMLMQPDVMLYDALFHGVNAEVKNRMMQIVSAFHRECKGRLSIFIQHEESLPKGIKADRIIVLEKGLLYARE
jgi:ABC-type transporter Mla maintaining outer membrane lipid asymmetry ATPase subunit MlaF